MAYENLPAALQPILQENMLARYFEEQLGALMTYRKSAKRNPVPIKDGETYIRSRAGRLAPPLVALNPANNTNLDNGLTAGGVGSGNNTYPFEQFLVSISQYAESIDLNIIQNYEAIAPVFMQNAKNLIEQAALNLDLICAADYHQAYESGRSYVTVATSASTTAHLDNLKGFDTAFQQFTMVDGSVFSGGTPQSTSVTYPVTATVYPASGAASYPVTVTGATPDGSNASTMIGFTKRPIGVSGDVTFSAAQTLAVGDVIVASDAPSVFRPNNKLSRLALTQSDTAAMQLFINAKFELERNNIPKHADGTYHCFIDPILHSQLFADPQFEIMAQGAVDSKLYSNAMVSKLYGLSFVPVTNSPSYSFVNAASASLVARHALIVGDQALLECPFEGTSKAIAAMADYQTAHVAIANDIAMVTRPALDRLQQIIAQSWFWIGGHVAPTDVTITPVVVPTASNARYKRAAVIEVASVN